MTQNLKSSLQLGTGHLSHLQTNSPYQIHQPNPNFSPNVKVSLKANYYPHSNRLQATLEITNTPSESLFKPSQIKLGSNLYPNSASYYDRNKIPREVWKVEKIFSQVEGYVRIHERWICGKTEWQKMNATHSTRSSAMFRDMEERAHARGVYGSPVRSPSNPQLSAFTPSNIPPIHISPNVPSTSKKLSTPSTAQAIPNTAHSSSQIEIQDKDTTSGTQPVDEQERKNQIPSSITQSSTPNQSPISIQQYKSTQENNTEDIQNIKLDSESNISLTNQNASQGSSFGFLRFFGFGGSEPQNETHSTAENTSVLNSNPTVHTSQDINKNVLSTERKKPTSTQGDNSSLVQNPLHPSPALEPITSSVSKPNLNLHAYSAQSPTSVHSPTETGASSGRRILSKLTKVTIKDKNTTIDSELQDNMKNILSGGVMSQLIQTNVIPLFQSPVCELYSNGDLILQHENATFLFSVNIPQNLPPAYNTGSLVKFRYVLKVKVYMTNSYYGKKVVEVEVPFKISNASASLARVHTGQIVSGYLLLPNDTFNWTVYYDHVSMFDGRRWFLDSIHPQLLAESKELFPNSNAAFETIRRYVSQKRGKATVNIMFKDNHGQVPDRFVCKLTIPNITFQIGDRIFFTFDFTRREIYCDTVACKLVSSEKIQKPYLKNADMVLDPSITDHVHATFVQRVSHLQNYPLYFVIPEETQPQFKTDVIELSWHLSFEFHLEGGNHIHWKLPIEIFNITPPLEQNIANVSETFKEIRY